MEKELAFCPACERQVHLAWTDAPLHEGHATLPDGPELVCLDRSEKCCGGTCPLSGMSGSVMALRLAKSGLAEGPHHTTRMRCDGCGQVAEMEVVDRTTLLCPLCGSVNRWILLELVDRGWVAIGRPGVVDD